MDAFRKHCETYREALAPVGVLEIEAVQDIAEDRWRPQALPAALENGHLRPRHRDHINAMDSGHAEVDTALAPKSHTWLQTGKASNCSPNLRAPRIKRSLFRRTKRQLQAMQSARKTAHAQALHEAMLLTELAQSKGELYDPAPDFPPTGDFGGFVYSTPEIARLMDRANRLNQAETARANKNHSPWAASKRN